MDSFLSDWITHPDYWFDATHSYDDYLTEKYQYLLQEPWDTTNQDPKYHLAMVILYDQIARHVYRNHLERERYIQEYTEKAYTIHQYIYRYFDVNQYSSTEWCFLSLPIRHRNQSREIIRVIQEGWQRLKKETEETEKKQLIKFLKASYERCPPSQVEYITEHTLCQPYSFLEFTHYMDILAHIPLHHEPHYAKTSMITSAFQKFIMRNKLKHVIISLSGGVDSMVSSFILKQQQTLYKYKLSAVYINYCNRSMKEYEFVRDWCQFLQIPLYVRHITEIQRKPCMEYNLRSTYEDYTKRVRFQTYKDVWYSKMIVGDFPKVVLGHNEDDCFENILTNICHKNKYQNLKGMESDQVVDDILFYRPMLTISKADIYQLAHMVGIPYLHDSTPSWSQRGQIRDKVRPALETWNKEMVPALFELSKRVQEYEHITYDMVHDMIQQIKQTDTNVYELSLPISGTLTCHIFWKKFFEELHLSVSYKSLTHFLENLESNLQRIQKVSCQNALNKSTIIKYKISENNHMKLKIFTHLQR
jgi:tRNA(Ile)-lysidine synthetase-like protein